VRAACRSDQEARGFYDLGLTTGSEIIRKPRASCSTIRRLCCSAWRACRSLMRRRCRMARWRYGRSPVIRPRRRARTAGRSRLAGMNTVLGPAARCPPGGDQVAVVVGSSPGGSAMSRAAIARRSPSGCRRCRRGAGYAAAAGAGRDRGRRAGDHAGGGGPVRRDLLAGGACGVRRRGGPGAGAGPGPGGAPGHR